MRIEQLQYLIEISKTHSFRKAAENLYITQPALSESIKKLEKELNVTLLKRTQSGVYVTEIGEEIIEIGNRIVTDATLIRKKTREFYYQTADFDDELNLLVRPAIKSHYISSIIDLLHQKQPSLRLTVFENNTKTILAAIKEDRCDLGLLTLREKTMHEYKQETEWTFKPIMPLQLYLVQQSTSPLAQKNTVSLQEISRLHLAVYSSDHEDLDVLDESIFEKFPKPQVFFRSDDIQLIYQRVQQEKLGLLVNKLRLSELPEGLTSVPIQELDDIYMYYLYKESSPKKTIVQYVIDQLDENIF